MAAGALEWENSKLIEGEVPEGIRALKAADGPELQVHGSRSGAEIKYGSFAAETPSEAEQTRRARQER
jgi:hypothetical protein